MFNCSNFVMQLVDTPSDLLDMAESLELRSVYDKKSCPVNFNVVVYRILEQFALKGSFLAIL